MALIRLFHLGVRDALVEMIEGSEMSYPGFEESLRRIVTGNDAQNRSTIIIDGPPGEISPARLLEIWIDQLDQPLDPKATADQSKGAVVLSPPKGGVKVRWFVVEPLPPGIPKPSLDAAIRRSFESIGAAHHLIDQTRHSLMHETESLDVICVLKGDVSLILEDGETRLKPGQVVIQRATNHAWVAHDGPALMLAVLIDRTVAR